MNVQIAVPGVSYAGSGLPKVTRQTNGFDYENLHFLGLFEDGSDASPMSVALDSSGQEHHGTLVTGSTAPIKTPTGVQSAGNTNFLFAVPGLTYGSTPYSIALVFRSMAPPANGGNYPMFWMPSSDVTGGSLGGTQTGTGNSQMIMADLSSAVDGPGYGAPHAFCQDGFTSGLTNERKPAAWTTGRPAGSIAGASRNSWFAFAQSFDPGTGLITFASANPNSGTQQHNTAAQEIAKGGLHAFGAVRWSAGVWPMGDLALAVVYREARNLDGLRDLLVKARGRAAGRGISAF